MYAASTCQAGDAGKRSLAAGCDRALGRLIEAVCAVLVLAEIVVLFSGVVARYAFHNPLVWSDELAGMLFLWLSMLGSVWLCAAASTCA